MSLIPGNSNVGAVLVCGAGIAGVQAALDLAESGFKVYLSDASAVIGGEAAPSDAPAPSGEAYFSLLSPKLADCARHDNIEILTLTDVMDISGQEGRFSVRVRRNPRYVDLNKCNACGDCADVCPIYPSEAVSGKGAERRKAISQAYPQAIPSAFRIVKAAGKTACGAGCPAGVNVQGFISLLHAGKTTEAYDLLRRRCPLPASSGRICRHPCEGKCSRTEIGEAVSIRGLERFAADAAMEIPQTVTPPENRLGKRVAVIGGGPAGLTAANDLVRMGCHVALFEAQSQPGGMLRYGIPAYRLPKDVLEKEIRTIIDSGVELHAGVRIVKPQELLAPGLRIDGVEYEPFDAVFVATGAWGARKMDVLGEDARGVWQALNFLYVVNSGAAPFIGPNVVVLGGNDLALDAARCALRLPGVQSVHLACLESWAEMPVDADEIEDAFREGVVVHNGLGPTRIEKSGNRASAVHFRACTSVYDEHRKFDPIFDDDNISTLAADTVIVAGKRFADAYGLSARPGGRIIADSNTLATETKGIFAGGEAVMGPASMVESMAQGHQAAEAILRYLKGEPTRLAATGSSKMAIAPNPDPNAPPLDRMEMFRAGRPGGKPDMSEINPGYDKSQALYEAARCLSCGLCGECMECVKVCSAGAIRLDEKPEERSLEVGAVIFTAPDERADFSGKGIYRTGRPSEDISGAIVQGSAVAAEAMRQLASARGTQTKAREYSGGALVIGGGLAGMTAGLYIADQGFPVHIVEKESILGGMLRGRRSTLEIEDISEYLRELEGKVRTHPKIRVYLNAALEKTSGRIGQFTSALNVDGNEATVNHAVVIVATGGRARTTERYLYGRHPQVVTQSSLETMLGDESLVAGLRDKKRPMIVMLQCVESLTARHPYCSRVCCAQALRNALEIKDRLPYAEIVIVGGQQLAKGEQEIFYHKALERRIRFVRHSGTDRPEVCEEESKLQVFIHDADVGRGLVVYPDLVALSTGIAPAESNPELSEQLRGCLTADGFFQTAHPGLRPVELTIDGGFVCGCAHSPQLMRDTVDGARAAAAQASRLIRNA